MTKPLNVLGGLNDALIKPLWGDIKDAYWLQRAARERYPMAETALNFVPYAGAAANVDSIVQDVRQGAYGNVPGDVAGAGVNATTTLAALKGFGAVAAQSSKAVKGLAGIGMVGLTGFAQAQMREQEEAAKRFDGMSLLSISNQLRNK